MRSTVWILCFSVAFLYGSIVNADVFPCENPFLLHDVYYRISDQYEGLSVAEKAKAGIGVCNPSHDIAEEYDKIQDILELAGYGLYPVDTFADSYRRISYFQRVLKSSGIFEVVKVSNVEREISKRLIESFLSITGIESLEEFKHLAETKPKDKIKLIVDVPIYYTFPESFFVNDKQHNIFKIIINLKKDKNIEESFFDYTLFSHCLSERSDRLKSCMEHNFMFNAYFNKLIWLRSLYSNYSTHETMKEDLSDALRVKHLILSDFFSNITEEDFYVYMKRGSRSRVSVYFNGNISESAWEHKNKLQQKIEEAVVAQDSNDKLTRQDKLDYLYFLAFEYLRPDEIKRNEYEKISRFYYGEEDTYKGLYELMEGQEISEMENPLFYSVLYKMIQSYGMQDPHSIEFQLDLKNKKYSILENEASNNNVEIKIEVRNKGYSTYDLLKICQLYHESLDKALQEATEERRNAFEAKNIKVCEM